MATDGAGAVARPAGNWTGPALGFSLGVGTFHLLAEPLPWGWLLAAAAGLAMGLALVAWRRGARWRVFEVGASALLIGFAWAQFHACLTLCHPFPERYTRGDLVVEGRIASLPAELGTARRFLFRVDAARLGDYPVAFTGLTRLTWYDSAPPLSVGERWRLRVSLKPPHGFANPGGFDLERWLFEQGIKATGHVRGSGDQSAPGCGSRGLLDRPPARGPTRPHSPQSFRDRRPWGWSRP